MQNVLTVEMIARYHSNQQRIGLFIAMNVSKSINQHNVAVAMVEDLAVAMVEDLAVAMVEDLAVAMVEDLAVAMVGGRSGGGYGGRSGGGYGGRSGGGYGGRDDRPREMFDAKCGDCGNDCQIPFKPREDRPVYCNECFQNHRQT